MQSSPLLIEEDETEDSDEMSGEMIVPDEDVVTRKVESNASEKASAEEEDKEFEKVEKEKDQTEHRLVIKVDTVDKSAKTMLLTVPLETIRKRRSQKAKVDCLDDILNYV